MKHTRPSRTGELAAIMRAIHQTADEEPKILADLVAPCLVDITGSDNDEWLRPLLSHPFTKQWRAGFLIRNRYAEDCLAECVAQGLRQYVIVGAGLDTFAFRQPAWASSVCVFEIDHPATQRWKRDRLAAAGITIPPNLRFVPIDFETTSLADALRATDFDFGNGAFCSWLGVTQYLTPTAISRMLKFVVSLPRSSEIVFSFIVPLETLSGIEAEALAMASRRSAEVGEPWLTTFRTEELKSQLCALGFSDVIHLTPEEAHERYLKNRRDGLLARRGEQLMRAIV
jgi:methyltransferase (TIGR00027 family)